MAARWYGFHHPHLELSYEFAIGTSVGASDVTGSFVEVGSVTEHTETSLSLMQGEVFTF